MKRQIIALLSGLMAAPHVLAGTEIASLPTGKTAYELKGSASGPLIVMIHGVSGPMSVWDALFEPLVNAGFKVLRYDLYGRGQSERVSRAYDQDLYQLQLTELLKSLRLESAPVHFIGSSMGNIIASEFAIRYPLRVKAMVVVGPAGFSIGDNFMMKLNTAPIIGDLMTTLLGRRVLMKRNREYFYNPEPFEVFLKRFEAQLSIPGSKQAILSTMRNMPVKNYIEGYQKLGKLHIPTLLFWGRHDVSFDFKFSEDFLRAIPHAQFIPVESAAHLPQLERPEIVTPEILKFLEGFKLVGK